MSNGPVLDRLIQAARSKGGEKLEIISGRPAVLVVGGNRLQAGNVQVPVDELETWVETLLPPERFVTFQLGSEIREVVKVGEVYNLLNARQAGGVVQVSLDLTPLSGPENGRAHKEEEVADEYSPKQIATGGGSELERPLDKLLRRLVELGGSDLHMTSSKPPMLRLHGDMMAFPDVTTPLSSEHILLMCEEVAPAKNRAEFRADNDSDFAYEIPGVARFRVNMFRDRFGVGAVFRQIPTEIRSMEDLGLPDCIRSLCMLSKGLVLVTGPTGSGKSTTLAAMIDYVNNLRTEHIITIEDPIEFVHENKKCLVNQREVYSHTGSFKRALRAALREDPDIVLVGELRDLETMAIAIETAETGHLVFGTLHTTTAVSTVDRMIDQFPADRQDQIRVMLSEALKGVIAQILLKKKGGGRVAAYEILLGVPAISNLIREGKTFQIPSIMQTSKRLGMRMLNDSLAELVRKGLVEVDEALAKTIDKDGLRSLLKLDQPDAQPSSERPAMAGAGARGR